MPQPKQQCFVIVTDSHKRTVGLVTGPYPTIEAAEAAIDVAKAATAEKYPETDDNKSIAWGSAAFPARPKIHSHFGVL